MVLNQWQQLLPVAYEVFRDCATAGTCSQDLRDSELNIILGIELKDYRAILLLVGIAGFAGALIGLCAGGFCRRALRALARALLRISAEELGPRRQALPRSPAQLKEL